MGSRLQSESLTEYLQSSGRGQDISYVQYALFSPVNSGAPSLGASGEQYSLSTTLRGRCKLSWAHVFPSVKLKMIISFTSMALKRAQNYTYYYYYHDMVCASGKHFNALWTDSQQTILMTMRLKINAQFRRQLFLKLRFGFEREGNQMNKGRGETSICSLS